MKAPMSRSAAAVAASRRNGALSRGPCSADGKAVSAQNSRKHGLFSAAPGSEAELAAGLTELASFIAELTGGRADLQMISRNALVAAARAERAGEIVVQLKAELALKLEEDRSDEAEVADLLTQIARIGRYERRFCGQRDRALRIIMKAAARPS